LRERVFPYSRADRCITPVKSRGAASKGMPKLENLRPSSIRNSPTSTLAVPYPSTTECVFWRLELSLHFAEPCQSFILWSESSPRRRASRASQFEKPNTMPGNNPSSSSNTFAYTFPNDNVLHHLHVLPICLDPRVNIPPTRRPYPEWDDGIDIALGESTTQQHSQAPRVLKE